MVFKDLPFPPCWPWGMLQAKSSQLIFQVTKESIDLPPLPHEVASGEGVSEAGNTGLSHHKAREGKQVTLLGAGGVGDSGHRLEARGAGYRGMGHGKEVRTGSSPSASLGAWQDQGFSPRGEGGGRPAFSHGSIMLTVVGSPGDIFLKVSTRARTRQRSRASRTLPRILEFSVPCPFLSSDDRFLSV